MSEPLISIVLPTFNRAEYLPEAIESCRIQTHRNWELIIVDDASTDETPSIVRDACARDPRIRSLRLATKVTTPAVLNAGFAEAKGDYLTWTSDDNDYEPEALEVMLRALLEDGDLGLVYCDMRRIGAKGEDLGTYDAPDPDAVRAGLETIGACFLYRRAVRERIGEYDVDAFPAEDLDYWMRISRHFPLRRLAGVRPYLYRVHGGSVTSQRSIEMRLKHALVRCRHSTPPAEQKNELARIYLGSYHSFMRAGAYRQAGHSLREAFASRPVSLLHPKRLAGIARSALARASAQAARS